MKTNNHKKWKKCEVKNNEHLFFISKCECDYYFFLFLFQCVYAMFSKQQAQATWNILIWKNLSLPGVFVFHSFICWFGVQRSHKRRLKHDFCLRVFFFFRCISFLLNHDMRYQWSSAYILYRSTCHRFDPLSVLNAHRATANDFTTQAVRNFTCSLWYLRKREDNKIFQRYFAGSCIHRGCLCMFYYKWIIIWNSVCAFTRPYPYNITHSIALMCCCFLSRLLFFRGWAWFTNFNRILLLKIVGLMPEFGDWKMSLFPFFLIHWLWTMLIHQFCIEKVHHLAPK